jgi:UDP-N-acetylmuramate--alanine ligase
VERLSGWKGTIVPAPDTVPDGWDVALPGSANADNARSVIGVGRVLGVDEAAIRESVASYHGVGRRMEVKGDVAGVVVIDDYGHHPTAIAKTLEAVRSRYPGHRVWAVYEPLTFHRTAQLLPRFAEVLATADEVAIADIWAGRDSDTTITSASALAQAVRDAGGPKATAPGSVEATAYHLAAHVTPGDVVLVMGGGRSYVIASRLLELLSSR